MLLKWIKLTSKRLVDNIAQLLKVYLKKKSVNVLVIN